MNILLIAGGWSSEREISLAGAENIATALKQNGHAVTQFDLATRFDDLLHEAVLHDFAFINLHGSPGEDGLVQAMLDTVGCPYQGSGPVGSFLALNKAAAKEIFRQKGLPTADWDFLPTKPAPDWQPRIPFPLFAKSNTGGSSLKLGRAANLSELRPILDDIFAANEGALLEPALEGVEITCAILGARPLPPILIEPVSGAFFDFQSKYAAGGAREICPAPISEEATRTVQNLALAAHEVLGLEGYSRSDFIMDKNGNFTLLEVNTLPGMTSASLLPKAAAAIGLNFGQLLEKLVDLGLNTARNTGGRRGKVKTL